MLIVGLGNIGRNYNNTYHNMGFAVADKLAKLLEIKFTRNVCKAKVACDKALNVIIAKPSTYMNLSGISVKALMKKFNIKPEDLMVVYDDIDILKGRIRVRSDGSAGTHNGMKNIIQEIGATNFIRVRIGIKSETDDLKEYVLSRISGEDYKILDAACEKAAKSIFDYIKERDTERLIREINN